MPGVWLGNVTAGIRVILILRLFVVVEGVCQIVHLVHIGIVQVGGVLLPQPGGGRLCRGKLGRRVRRRLSLVWVANCWVFSLIVIIDTTVERGICFIS